MPQTRPRERSSLRASERRARKSSVSTAPSLSESSAAISRYDSPCHSRIRIARRWFGGQLGERVGDARQLLVRVLRRRPVADEPVVRDDLDAAAPPGRAAPLAADVRRDREHPRRLGARDGAAAQAAVGVQEGLLDRVLGLLPRGQARAAEAEQLAGVALVEQPRLRGLGGRGGLAECRCGTHGWATWCSCAASLSVSAAGGETQVPASSSATTTCSAEQPLFR